MESPLIYVFAVVLVSIVLLLKGAIHVKQDHRIVVFRLGKHEATFGPGLVLLVPFIDIPIYVNLTKHVPDWRSLKEEEVREKVEKLVLNDPDPKKYR